MIVRGAEEALSRAKVKLRQHSPYFAVLTMFADYRFDPNVEVAETDGRKVLLNEDAWIAFEDDQRIGLLLHVTLHAALQHPSRMHGREPQLWNIACDVMVNHILRTQTPFPPPPGTFEAANLDPGFVPETAELVYEWLQRHHEVAVQLVQMTVVGGGIGAEAEDQAAVNPEPTPSLPKALRKSAMAAALAARFGTPASNADKSKLPPQPGRSVSPSGARPLRDIRPQPDRAQQGSLQQHWNGALIRAREHEEARRKGTDPAGWLRELKAASEPELDWRTLLARFVIQTPTDFAGFDRRFVHRGLYIESLEQQTISVAVAIDTSGSMSEKDLNQISTELDAIVSVYPHIECSLYYCDAELHGPYDLHAEDARMAMGGGGTDFRPFFSHLEELSTTRLVESPSAAIYFTDGFGDFPAILPSIPTMWVVLPGGARNEDFPFGQVIRMNSP